VLISRHFVRIEASFEVWGGKRDAAPMPGLGTPTFHSFSAPRGLALIPSRFWRKQHKTSGSRTLATAELINRDLKIVSTGTSVLPRGA
jgi:hypothetical protein